MRYEAVLVALQKGQGDSLREADPGVYAAEAAARAVGPVTPGDAEVSAPADCVLLAQWDISLDTRESATLHWVIPRQNLAELRFERTHVSFFWNP